MGVRAMVSFGTAEEERRKTARVEQHTGTTTSQAVAKRPGVPTGLPNNVRRTCCGFHEMFLEQFWLGRP
eukprot:1928554-Pyramimonas_sp.AAC.1